MQLNLTYSIIIKAFIHLLIDFLFNYKTIVLLFYYLTFKQYVNLSKRRFDFAFRQDLVSYKLSLFTYVFKPVHRNKKLASKLESFSKTRYLVRKYLRHWERFEKGPVL